MPGGRPSSNSPVTATACPSISTAAPSSVSSSSVQLVRLVRPVPGHGDHRGHRHRHRLAGREEDVPAAAHDVELAVDGLGEVAEQEGDVHRATARRGRSRRRRRGRGRARDRARGRAARERAPRRRRGPPFEWSSCSTPRLTTATSPWPELLRLVADRHRHVTLEDDHHLLRVLVGVPRNRRAGLVDHAAHEHLVSADGMDLDRGEDLERLDPVPGPNGEFTLALRSGICESAWATAFTDSSSSNATTLPSRLGPGLARCLLLQRPEHALGRDRQLRHPDADGVVDGRGDGRRLRVVGHLAAALRAVRTVR